MEFITSRKIILELALFFLGLLCLDAHIHPGTSACPERCICTAGNAVICAGLELSVVPIDLPRDTRYLDLRNNQIDKLSRQTFEQLVELEQLNLHANRIHTIGSEVIDGLPWLKELDITHNALHCDCSILWIDHNRKRLTAVDQLICTSPNEYQGMPVLDVLDRLQCPSRLRHTRNSEPCVSNPCLNGATCLDDDSNGYHCICRSGYVGLQCDRWITNLPPLEVLLSDITSNSILITWWFPDVIPIMSFYVTCTPDYQIYTQLPKKEHWFTPDARSTFIDDLLPGTKYTVCVTAKPPVPLPDVNKQCAYTETLQPSRYDGGRGHGRDHSTEEMGREDSDEHGPRDWEDSSDEMGRDHGDGHRPPPPPDGHRPPPPPKDHRPPGDLKKSPPPKPPPPPKPKPHKMLMIVFGAAIALCFIAIFLVTLLYCRRYHDRRNNSTTPPNSPHSNSSNITIDRQRTCPDNIPVINIVDMSNIADTQNPPPPYAPPPNTPTLPSYETAMREQPYESYANQAMGKQGESNL